MPTPIIGSNYSPAGATEYPLAFNNLDPVGALSDSAGLVGAYLFGGSRKGACRNYANPELPLRVIGNPTVNAGGGTSLDYANGFDTRLAEPSDFSILVIAKAPAGKGIVISNGAGAAALPQGVYLEIGSYGGAAAPISAAATSSVTAGSTPAKTGAGSAPMWSYPTTNYVQLFARGDAVDVSASARCSSQAQVNSAAVATGSRGLNKRSLRIGAAYTGSGVAALDLLAAYVFSVKQSDAVRNANFAAVAAWFNTNLGIATL